MRKKYRITFRIDEKNFLKYKNLKEKTSLKSSLFFISQFNNTQILFFNFDECLDIKFVINQYGVEINQIAMQLNACNQCSYDPKLLEKLFIYIPTLLKQFQKKYCNLNILKTPKYFSKLNLKVDFFVDKELFLKQRMLFRHIKKIDRSFTKQDFYTSILLKKHIFIFNLDNLFVPTYAFSQVRNNLKQISRLTRNTNDFYFFQKHLNQIQFLFEDFVKMKRCIENFREEMKKL